MISRFNLDVKRMYYYDEKDKFNSEFILSEEFINDKEHLIDIKEPGLLIVSESVLKIHLKNQNVSREIILFSNQSLSLIEGDNIKSYTFKDKLSKFKIFKLKK